MNLFWRNEEERLRYPYCNCAGNEAVLRARFEDAQFFYSADLRQPLEAFLPKLAGTQFHKTLGNLLQKSERTAGLIRPLAQLTGLTGTLLTPPLITLILP